jgi:hypothetical protein
VRGGIKAPLTPLFTLSPATSTCILQTSFTSSLTPFGSSLVKFVVGV